MTSPTGSARRPQASRPEDGSATTVVVKHSTGTKYVPAGLPVELVKRLHAVVSHCTVHNTLREPPTVDIKIDAEPVLVPD